MPEKIDLKKMEKKLYLSYHQDGLWDIFLGLFLIVMGFLFYFNIESYLVIIPAGFLFPLFLIRRTFSSSRLGYVVFSKERQAKEKRKHSSIAILSILSFLSGIAAFFAASSGRAFYNFLDSLPFHPIALFLTIVIGTITAIFGIWRFMGYSALIIFIFFVGNRTGDQIIGPSVLTGIIISTIGLIIFIRFIRKYPKRREGISDEIINRS